MLVALQARFIGGAAFTTWLRAHATVRSVQSPPGGRLSVAIHQYPQLGGVTECLGFGQGYVQLYEPETGTVLHEKTADDLAAIRAFAWGQKSVVIDGFAEWEIPEPLRARN